MSNSHIKLCALLVTLRATYMVHQNAHWILEGQSSYSDHIMLERLYGGMLEEIDTLAEKIVTYGPVDIESQTLGIYKLVKSWCGDAPYTTDSYALLQRSLDAEACLQQCLEDTYNYLKEEDDLTLGMDDFLMATANAHETSFYLLSQRLRNA